jgi:hypothetical protein
LQSFSHMRRVYLTHKHESTEKLGRTIAAMNCGSCRQRLQCVVKLNRPRECIRDAQLKLSRDLAAVACKVKDINRLLTLCVD